MNKIRYYQIADDHQAGNTCPRCGKSVKPGAGFCGHCGFRLGDSKLQSAANVTPTEDSTGVRGKKMPPRRQNNRHGGGWKIWLTVLLVVLLGIGYWWGNQYYTPVNQLHRDVTALKNGQKGIAKQFTSLDPSLKLTDAAFKPLTAYFKSNRNALADFQRQLQQASATSDGLFTFQKTGKVWLFFDKYKIAVKPVYPVLETNHKNVKLSINGKRVGTSDQQDYRHKFGPYVPGKYTLSAVGTVNGHKITNSNTYYLRDDTTYDLQLRTISFKVVGAPGTKILLNGRAEGTLNRSGELAIKDVPWSNHLQINGKYTTDGTTITSKATQINKYDAGGEVSVVFPNVLKKDEAQRFVTSLFSLISSYTYDPETDQTEDGYRLDQLFVDGKQNKEYQEFTKMASGYHNDDNILSVRYEPHVKTVAPGGKNESKITYDVEYDFNNTHDERVQVFRYTATVKKSGDSAQVVKISPAQKIKDERQ